MSENRTLKVTPSGVEIPFEVEDQLREIREIGTVNMISANGVQEEADSAGLYELADFIEEHRRTSRSVPVWVEVLNAVFAEEG